MEGRCGISRRNIQDKISRVPDFLSERDRLGIGTFLPNEEKHRFIVTGKRGMALGYGDTSRNNPGLRRKAAHTSPDTS